MMHGACAGLYFPRAWNGEVRLLAHLSWAPWVHREQPPATLAGSSTLHACSVLLRAVGLKPVD